MKRTGLGFKDIIELTQSERVKELQEKTPVDEIILEMAIHHLPNPLTAQKYRIPHLWKGDIESQNGKDMIECNPDGKPIGVCFGVMNDPHAGEVALVRLFSGTVKKGDQLYLASTMSYEKIQQLGIYMGKERVVCNELTAGNIAGIVGLKDVYVGETISSEPVEPFEEIKHYSEPVITKSIEAKNSKDLSKLIQALRAISKEDPTIRVKINQETGEHLISGMGELHLEIIEYKLKNEKKIDIVTSPPIVVYRETIHKKGPEVEGKSPNKHTKLLFSVEPLEPEFIKQLNDSCKNQCYVDGMTVVYERDFQNGRFYNYTNGFDWLILRKSTVIVNTLPQIYPVIPGGSQISSSSNFIRDLKLKNATFIYKIIFPYSISSAQYAKSFKDNVATFDLISVADDDGEITVVSESYDVYRTILLITVLIMLYLILKAGVKMIFYRSPPKPETEEEFQS